MNNKKWKKTYNSSLDESIISVLASFEVENIEIDKSVLDYALKRQRDTSVYRLEIEKLKKKYSQLAKA